jgi:hypothetical protein
MDDYIKLLEEQNKELQEKIDKTKQELMEVNYKLKERKEIWNKNINTLMEKFGKVV